MENLTMVIDLYEFTMAKTYFENGEKDKEVCFDVFFRKNPFDGGYTVSGGLDEIIDYIKNFKLTSDDIDFLRDEYGLDNEEFLDYLRNLKFTGDMFSVPNGTIVFPNEPVITIKTKIIEAQLLETAILSYFNHGSLVTTAAKRITNAAGNKAVMEFGARRARGAQSSVEASKHAYIGGCLGTSNLMAAKKYGIPAMGTMAHSMICDSVDEYSAFLKYAKSNPNNCVFLVDTYDTLRSGIPNAIRVADEYLKPNGLKFKGIRIDSGDLAYLSKEARKMLDDAGYEETQICLSNGLNEYTISSLVNQGAMFDSLGVGDNIAASKERVGGVYKLVSIFDGNKYIPRIKVSNDSVKTINPGYKRVFRFYDNETGYALGDVITLYDEELPKDKYVLISPKEEWKRFEITNYSIRELQVPIYVDGILVYNRPSVLEQKEYCEHEFTTIYPEIKRLENPHEYYVDLSEKLLALKKELIQETKDMVGVRSQFKRVRKIEDERRKN